MAKPTQRMSVIRVKRVYDPPAVEDGFRILVDRLWPRGLRREAARIDLWLKDVAPSAELRRWFAHDPARWPAFQERYRAELAGNAALDVLLDAVQRSPTVTFVFGARDVLYNNALVLHSVCEERL